MYKLILYRSVFSCGFPLTICGGVWFLQLESNLLQHVSSLVWDSDSDLWRNGRFLVHIGRQLASHKDG